MPHAEDAVPSPRAVRAGVLVVAGAVLAQTVVHLVNTATGRTLRWDVNSEYTVFSVLHALVIAAAAAGAVAVLRAGLLPRRAGLFLAAALTVFALDDLLVLHERATALALRLAGVSPDWDSVVWPLLYLPVTGAVFLLVAGLARRAARPDRRLLVAGLVLLVVAVVVEMATAAWSTAATAAGLGHGLAGAVEEACELGGWGLLAVGSVSCARRERRGGPVRRRPAVVSRPGRRP
ncbi:hypothetical protein, partial [Geodermatophilus sp. SYSU D01119]